MSLPYNKSSQFRTQVNQANVIKQCYPCGSNIPCSQTIITPIPNDLTVSTLTVGGKATILGLIDPTGMEFTPVSTNPGNIQANTIWANSTDLNKLYYGNSVVGGGGGWVGTATSDLDMAGYNITNASSIANASGDVVVSASGNIRLDTLNDVFLGDEAGVGNGTYLHVRDASQRIYMITPSLIGNGNVFDMDGPNERILIASDYGTVDINNAGVDISTVYGIRLYGGGAGVVIGDGVGNANNTVFTLDDNDLSLTLTSVTQTSDYIKQQLASGTSGPSGIEIKSKAGYVKFLDSTNALKASLDYLEINDKVTLLGTNVTVSSLLDLTLSVGVGSDLRLTNVPAVTTTTAHNVGLKATSTGLNIINYLKVKLGGADIWIPYLTTDPSL